MGLIRAASTETVITDPISLILVLAIMYGATIGATALSAGWRLFRSRTTPRCRHGGTISTAGRHRTQPRRKAMTAATLILSVVDTCKRKQLRLSGVRLWWPWARSVLWGHG